jgi:tetratricopeptide (TPR) repeat protein
MGKTRLITCILIFVLTLGIYLFTLCPTIYWEDSAAFSAVHVLLGIPHSPGFPIYVLLGRLFLLFPIANSALLSNLMSAFWGSLSLVVLFLLISSLKRNDEDKLIPHNLIFLLSSIIGVLFLAFTSSFWLQAVRAEVYSLNLFFTIILIFLSIKWAEDDSSLDSFKVFVLFSFVFGLSLANHPLLIVTLAPAFLLYFLMTDGQRFLTPTRLMMGMLFFLLGTSVYLYLPIRAGLSPAVNWGNPHTVFGLLSYLLRTSQPVVASTAVGLPYIQRLGFNLSFPVIQFGLAFFWLAVVGALWLYHSDRKTFLFTFGIFILNLLTASWAADFSLRNYDLLGYLLPSLSMFAVWFALGMNFALSWLAEKLKARQKVTESGKGLALNQGIWYVVLGIIILSPLVQICRNYATCNKRSQTWAYRYADQILSSVKKDALILVGDDNTLTPLWYLNLASGKRPDVKILSISAVNQTRYKEQIGRQYPGIKLPSGVTNDLGELALKISEFNSDNLPVYTTYFSTHPKFVQHLIPDGYMYELYPKKVILTDNDIERQEGFLRRNLKPDRYDTISREHFGNIVFNLGGFYDRVSIPATSMEYFLWALEIDPSNPRIYFQLGKAFLKNGDKHKAFEFFQAGLELDPYNQEAIKLLEQG